MRSPFHDSEFSRTLDRLHHEPTNPYESEFGAIPDGLADATDGERATRAEHSLKTGTTTVGLTTQDGVVLAADQRASLGGQIVANKDVQKIEELQPNAAMTMAGSVGGAQAFIRQTQAECNLFEARRGEYMNIDALATLMGNMLRGGGLLFLVTPILGGVDEHGPKVYSLDPSGSSLQDAYTATGSGMQYAYGLLEQEYDESHSLEEAVPVAAEAIRSATERDTASGNGVHIAEITAEGVRIHGHDSFDEVL